MIQYIIIFYGMCYVNVDLFLFIVLSAVLKFLKVLLYVIIWLY